jgi:phytoene synthase
VDYSLAEAYASCAAHTRAEAKNFYYAFVMLPSARRRAIYALYSFCRTVDDAADEAPSPAIAEDELKKIRYDLALCLEGRPPNLQFAALADTITRFGLKPEHLLAVIDGVEQDLTVTRYDDFDQLRDYCWKVAGAVGLLSLAIFGYSDSRAEAYAEDLGLAMQLTNILRDIKEDLARDRIYLPRDEMVHYGITEEILARGELDSGLRDFLAFQAERARHYFESGLRLIPLVDYSSRVCPMMLHAVYSRVLDHIEGADYDVFSQRRGPSGSEKVGLLLKVWLRCLRPW